MHRNVHCIPGSLKQYLLVSLFLIPSIVSAETRTSLSSFGSIGGGRVLTSGGEFADYDTDWRFDTDSVVGVQLDVASATGVTFTTQAVARGFDYSDAEAHYDPSIELMFLAYQVSDNLRVRGGLIRTPFFIHSESLEVGYTYPWVRPPIDVYSPHALAVTHVKGVDTSFYQPIGNALLEWRLIYGNYDTTIETAAFEYDLELSPILGSTLSLTWNEWLVRYSLYRATASFLSDDLTFVQQYYQSLASVDPIFNVLARNVGGRNQTTIYHVLGAQFEKSGWTLTTEFDYEPATDEQFSVGLWGAYFSVAYQIEKFTPYLLVSYTESRPSDYLYDQLRASESVVAPGNNVLLDIIRQGTHQAYEAVDFSNTRYAVGMRYDINDHLDLKAELEHFTIDRAGNSAQLPDEQNMLTVVLDWVL